MMIRTLAVVILLSSSVANGVEKYSRAIAWSPLYAPDIATGTDWAFAEVEGETRANHQSYAHSGLMWKCSESVQIYEDGCRNWAEGYVYDEQINLADAFVYVYCSFERPNTADYQYEASWNIDENNYGTVTYNVSTNKFEIRGKHEDFGGTVHNIYVNRSVAPGSKGGFGVSCYPVDTVTQVYIDTWTHLAEDPDEVTNFVRINAW